MTSKTSAKSCSGILHVHDCSSQPLLPIWHIVAGSTGLVVTFSLSFSNYHHCRWFYWTCGNTIIICVIIGITWQIIIIDVDSIRLLGASYHCRYNVYHDKPSSRSSMTDHHHKRPWQVPLLYLLFDDLNPALAKRCPALSEALDNVVVFVLPGDIANLKISGLNRYIFFFPQSTSSSRSPGW